jgi:hypothetical protein
MRASFKRSSMSALRCVRSSSGLLLAGLARGSESGRRARYLSGATVHTPAVAAAPDPRPTADEAGAGAPPPPAARDQDPSIVRVLGVVRPYVWPAHRPDIQRAVVVAGLLIAGSKIATVSTPLVFKQAIDALANAAPTALGGGGGDAIDASTVAAQTAADAAAVTTAVLADANALAALAALAPAAQGALLLVGAYGGLRVAAIGMQELRNAVFARVAHAASRSLGRALFSRLHAEQASSLHARTPAASLARVVDRATKAAQSLLSGAERGGGREGAWGAWASLQPAATPPEERRGARGRAWAVLAFWRRGCRLRAWAVCAAARPRPRPRSPPVCLRLSLSVPFVNRAHFENWAPVFSSGPAHRADCARARAGLRAARHAVRRALRADRRRDRR